MTDLKHLLDQPPRERSPAPKPAFTAAVMQRVRALPAAAAEPAGASAPAAPAAPVWPWWLIAVSAALALATLRPGDLELSLGDLDVGPGLAGLAGFGGELIVAATVAGLALLAATVPWRSVRGRRG